MSQHYRFDYHRHNKVAHSRSVKQMTSCFTYIGGNEQKKYDYLLVDVKGKDSNIALVQLNRPKALNALCDGLMKEVNNKRLFHR